MITGKAAEEDKWARLYMDMAKAAADNNHACHSRKYGIILVGEDNSVISAGYNGPPTKTPHCDSHEYVNCYLSPVLPTETTRKLLTQPDNCSICPRRAMAIPSGQKLEYCTCVHAELNTLLQAARCGARTAGSTMYCWTCLPCLDCTKAIIQAGVIKIICLAGDYDKFSSNLFKMSTVAVYRYDPVSRSLTRESFTNSL